MFKKTFLNMLNAMGDNLSNLAMYNNDKDEEDEKNDEEDSGLGKLSEVDKPSWVMGTISTIVQQHMEAIQHQQMWHDQLTQPEWVDTANCFHERDMKYKTAVLLQMARVVATPALPTCGKITATLDNIPMNLRMLQG
jgi:hypothetical protein